jgi:hypothetical protein
VLQVHIHELREGESREKAFAELAACYPQNVAGKTVDDLDWSDDLVGAQEKALAEHIAAHPEHAGLTIEDFRWIVREIVSPNYNWRLENDRVVWDEPPPIDVESEEDGWNDPAGAPTGNRRRAADAALQENSDLRKEHVAPAADVADDQPAPSDPWSFSAGLKERSSLRTH